MHQRVSPRGRAHAKDKRASVQVVGNERASGCPRPRLAARASSRAPWPRRQISVCHSSHVCPHASHPNRARERALHPHARVCVPNPAARPSAPVSPSLIRGATPELAGVTNSEAARLRGTAAMRGEEGRALKERRPRVCVLHGTLSGQDHHVCGVRFKRRVTPKPNSPSMHLASVCCSFQVELSRVNTSHNGQPFAGAAPCASYL